MSGASQAEPGGPVAQVPARTDAAESGRAPADFRRRDALPVWVRSLGALFGWGVAIFLFIYFIGPVSTVALGILAATIVACLLTPLLRFMPGPRAFSAGILGLGLIAAVGALLMALSWPLAGPIQRQVDQWPQTQRLVDEWLERWSHRVGISDAPTAAELIEGQRQLAIEKGLSGVDKLTADDRDRIQRDLRTRHRLTVERIMEKLGSFLAGEGGQELFSRSADVSLGILVWLVFTFIGSIFLLSEPRETLLAPAIRLAPPRHRRALMAVVDELGPRLRRWAVGTMISMTIVFTASLVGYSVIRLELAFPLALLAGLCEIVPTVGPAVACTINCIFAAATAGSGSVIGVLVVYAIIQAVEAYVILPMIMRGAVKIHPAVTLFTVVFWGKVFGVPGLMLAIPINLVIWSVLKHFLTARYHNAE